MFAKCIYCNDSNCWGHTNDEKSAMDQAKRAEENSTKYYNEIQKLKKDLIKLKHLIEKMQAVIKVIRPFLSANSNGYGSLLVKDALKDLDAINEENK